MQRIVAVAFLLSITCPAIALPGAKAAPGKATTEKMQTDKLPTAKVLPINQARTVSIVFPLTSIGTICKVPFRNGVFSTSEVLPFCAAMGPVNIKLAPDEVICLKFNGRVLKSPQLIDAVPPENISGIRVEFMSMADDNSHGVCDAMFPHFNHFPNLTFLLLDRSDTSDKGLMTLKPMPEVVRINAAMTGITGTFLQRVEIFPALSCLTLYDCQIDSKALVWLPKAKKLRVLDFHHTGIGIEAMRPIGQCVNLENLRLSENPKINDACMLPLAQLKKLKFLELQNTSVTAEGLRKLAPLAPHLELLRLSKYMDAYKDELQRLFPKCRFDFLAIDKHLDAAARQIWAPLK